jgi:hypothetical protein
MRRLRLLAAAAAAATTLLALPSGADAHSVMARQGSALLYNATDDVAENRLNVTTQGSNLRFYDPGADGGISPAEGCTPGDTDNQGFIIEVICPRAGLGLVRIDVGEAEDSAILDVPINTLVVGGRGADTLTTTSGARDTINGGDGNDRISSGGGNDSILGGNGDDTIGGGGGDDTLQGGLGIDSVAGESGNDELRLRDGLADTATCGDGADRVEADQADQPGDGGACEAFERQDTAPPPDSGSTRGDRTPPRVRVGGSTRQRLRRNAITVLATSSEAGEAVAAGYVIVGDSRYPLRNARGRIRVGGGGVALRPRLTAARARAVARALRRRRRVTVVVSVVATDRAGNSATARMRRIALRR